MFYWKGKTQNGITLTDELLLCDSVKTVHIATAAGMTQYLYYQPPEGLSI